MQTRAALEKEIGTLHVFIYDCDSLGRLDSYHRFDSRKSGQKLTCTSRAGRKIFAAVANLDMEKLDWRETSSFEALEKCISRFNDDSPDLPVMTSVTEGFAGSNLPVTMALERLFANIRLVSVSCDFKGREYEGAVIKNAKAYLININGSSELFRRKEFTVSEMLNFHKLNAGDSPSNTVSADIGDIGDRTISPGISLYCYPNDASEDTASAPMTRLVIEGEVNGTKYYWPVTLRPERNMRYDLTVRITRTGTDSPDLPADTASVEVVCKPVAWNEKDEQTVLFKISGSAMQTRSQDPDESIVTDLSLYVFNSDDMLEQRMYLSGKALNTGIRITLLKNARYSIYAIANSGYFLRGITNKEEMLSFRYHLTYPDELRTGIPMSGKIEDFVPGDRTQADIGLERLMAKVSLKIDRTGLDPGVRVLVRNVAVGGCPNSVKVFGSSKAENERGVFVSGFSKSWGQLDALNMDRTVGVSGEVSLYMLENMQGELLPGNASLENKVFPEGDLRAKVCPYVELKMEYYSPKKNTPPGKYLIYRFFLGEGPGDFDVERNCHYHFTVKLSGDGLSGTGWSVDKSALK